MYIHTYINEFIYTLGARFLFFPPRRRSVSIGSLDSDDKRFRNPTQPSTRNPTPDTRKLKTGTRNPKLETRNPKA